MSAVTIYEVGAQCAVVDVGATDEPVAVLARRVCAERGKAAVLVHSSADSAAGRYWLASPHASGWITDTTAATASAQVLAQRWSAQMQRGFVPVDAALLALGASGHSLPGFGWDDDIDVPIAAPAATQHAAHPTQPTNPTHPTHPAPLGLYAIAASAVAVRGVLDAGIRTVQLRIKRPADADAAWQRALRASLCEAVATAQGEGAALFINDHWRLAAELGAQAVHLGQEDLAALGAAGRTELLASGLALGVSSHAVWELCRARALAPRYIACGPVWPTTTKDMPWRPQGLHNLAWWCRAAQVPVVAIGGILTPPQVFEAARAGADGVCVLRGLGDNPQQAAPALLAAFEAGHAERTDHAPEWPLPSLEPAA